MNSLKQIQMSVLAAVTGHRNSPSVSIVSFVMCAILFCLTISLITSDQTLERGDVEGALENQACHLVTLLQPDDEDEDEDDEEEEAAAPDMFANWRTTEGKVLGAKRLILKQEFEIEINRIDSVCELEPKQMKKLEIAAKGGVKKVLKEWLKETLTRFGGFNVNRGDDPDREPAEEEEYEDITDVDPQTLQLANNGFFSGVRTKTISNNEFWKKTLKSTLSKEQAKAWKDFVAQQLEMKREKKADAAIESFNIKFGLTSDQKEKFVELVRPELLSAKLELVETVGTQYEHYLYDYYATRASTSKMKKILTKPQMQQWELLASTSEGYRSWFENTPVAVRRRNRNVWEMQGVGLGTLIEAAVEAVNDFSEGVVGFGKRILKIQK